MRRKYYLILCCMLAIFLMVGCGNNSTKKTDDVAETTSEIENESDKETHSEESTAEEVTSEEATTEIVTEPVSTETTTEKTTEKATTETTTQKQTEEQSTEKATTPNPKTLLKINEGTLMNGRSDKIYYCWYKASDDLLLIYDLFFMTDGSCNSGVFGYYSESYMKNQGWELSDNFYEYDGVKYYAVFGGGGYPTTYSLTEEKIIIEIDSDSYSSHGNVVLIMTTDGNIIVESAKGIDLSKFSRFRVGNEFILK